MGCIFCLLFFGFVLFWEGGGKKVKIMCVGEKKCPIEKCSEVQISKLLFSYAFCLRSVFFFGTLLSVGNTFDSSREKSDIQHPVVLPFQLALFFGSVFSVFRETCK